MTINNLLTQSNFPQKIQELCHYHEWILADINNRRAILQFKGSSGTAQLLFIVLHGNTLEFSVPTLIQFNSFEEIPHRLSSYLLSRSSEKKYGFWCIEEISNKQVFSVMHNADISLIDAEYFGNVIKALVNESEIVEITIKRLVNS